ncbi:hypothetical protein BMF94_4495 [Rhodotorula taiwanensis]|uniref:Protein kinase domain-containing protein n=1 Tax=Rhodotorula taiwanensis TaxID=741276 RepID=A0A2S5B7C2_9BASI|nr:hypothetical protein BMF94_4495 [Rhodotorula taiwanensis]
MASRLAAVQVEQPRPSRSYATNSTAAKSNRRTNNAPYRIERVRNAAGYEQEVLTLEDTPEPDSASSSRGAVAQPNPTASSSSYTNGNAYASTSGARYDPYGGYEPVTKKRKSDVGAGANGYSAYASGSNGYPQPGTYAAPAASSSGLKRKYDGNERENRDATRPRVKDKAAAPPPVQQYSDQDGHYIVQVDAIVTDTLKRTSYRIKRLLGQGTFGKVVEAEDMAGRRYAVKIIRAVHKYQEAAKTEVRVLAELRKNDEKNTKKCIPLLRTFDFHGHTCLVTPLLSASVFDFLKDNNYAPFPLSHVQSFARQLLRSVAYVHERKLVHTDLKPENILLEDNSSVTVPSKQKGKTKKLLKDTGIQLIDFGSATYQSEYHATVVSTRHYRAPEIILCTGWDYACDMWSVGCILVEFVTGEALFQTHDNLEHLAMMEAVFGKMPQTLVDAGQKKTVAANPDWFKRGRSRKYELNFPQQSTQKQSTKFVRGMKKLRDIIAPRDAAGEAFYELCEGLLRWEPKQRWNVEEALRSEFLSPSCEIDDEGSFSRRY